MRLGWKMSILIKKKACRSKLHLRIELDSGDGPTYLNTYSSYNKKLFKLNCFSFLFLENQSVCSPVQLTIGAYHKVGFWDMFYVFLQTFSVWPSSKMVLIDYYVKSCVPPIIWQHTLPLKGTYKDFLCQRMIFNSLCIIYHN